jgi:hypothetical protein
LASPRDATQATSVIGGSSTLQRLFVYAKASGAAAIENFTTEALAGAIRADPAPFLSLLREAGIVPAGSVSDLAVVTQMVMPGTGIVDLVLVTVVERERREFWGELKIRAAESGTQLDAYRRHIASLDGSRRPTLFVLGPRRLRDDPSIPFVSWHQLRRRILELDSKEQWLDLAHFLAEEKMSDDFDQPIGAGEAAAMADFAGLFGKTVRILDGVRAEGMRLYPDLAWPSSSAALARDLTKRFARFQQLFIFMEPRRNPRAVAVVLGVGSDGAEANVEVRVETFPSQADLQRWVVGLADAAGFSPSWRREFGPWGGLRISERLVTLGDHPNVEAWFLERLAELRSSGNPGAIGRARLVRPCAPRLDRSCGGGVLRARGTAATLLADERNA